VAYTTELIDTDGWFASNRYTPQLAGYYQISCGARVFVVGGGIDKEASIGLRKNNTVIAIQGGYGTVTSAVSQLVYLNGSTDYVDVSISNATTGNVVQAIGQTYFTGYWVRP
jgi:Na+/glutamate symporter